ncbi:hypothetical protein WMY93_001756 [Mugilogobius chulae]|uniref:Uncharacterized protein n=1 Tax=Mugilogobius chulae TaxID=88201 RepID=A0AAW0PTX5_9GOBI
MRSVQSVLGERRLPPLCPRPDLRSAATFTLYLQLVWSALPKNPDASPVCPLQRPGPITRLSSAETRTDHPSVLCRDPDASPVCPLQRPGRITRLSSAETRTHHPSVLCRDPDASPSVLCRDRTDRPSVLCRDPDRSPVCPLQRPGRITRLSSAETRTDHPSVLCRDPD